MNEIQIENNKRLEVLHRKHHKWLLGAGYKITRQLDTSKELISDLYLYLADKPNPSLWYEDSFNLIYCRSFLSSRFINKVKRDKKTTYLKYIGKMEVDEYDFEMDDRLEQAHQQVLQELRRLDSTKYWTGSKLSQLYFFSDFTLDSLAKEIGLSKSTVFLKIKKIKSILKHNIDNPFTTKVE